MAGQKKKKKPAANPARGFATTSVASKPRPELTESDSKAAVPSKQPSDSAKDTPPAASAGEKEPGASAKETPLSAEEFEKQLEESQLQLLVEKYAEKIRRDSQRQRSRLETDRRLLRSQADSTNTLKWLPEEILEYILDLVKAESRFSSSTISTEVSGGGKLPSEEDLIVRLWTLQQTLLSTGFLEGRVHAAVKHILDIAPNISSSVKDSIWGMEESFEWLARECELEELPDYEPKTKAQTKETPNDSPFPSRSATPKPADTGSAPRGKADSNGQSSKAIAPVKKPVVAYDSDIEPDELVPQYLDSKAKILELSRNLNKGRADDAELAVAKFEAKIRKIESDVLFDKALAEHQWKSKKIEVEQQLAALRSTMVKEVELPTASEDSENDETSKEADRIAAEILAENDSDGEDLAGLFDSLPQSEVDPNTGLSKTVITSTSGAKIHIRDFGKSTGVNPKKILEDACRSRDSSAKLAFAVVSEASFANRHSVEITWTKPQSPALPSVLSELAVTADSMRFSVTMKEVATPDTKQSEAYVSTAALFHIFSNNPREEKVHLKLPPAWRDFWSELAEAKKNDSDAKDRTVVRQLRDLVRQRTDQELEDGVILQGAFRGRGAAKSSHESSVNGRQSKPKPVINADACRKIWTDKCGTTKYQTMLQSRMQLPMWNFKAQVLQAVEDNQVVIICGETGCGKSTQVPSFLLEHELSNGRACKIYCTEPRRISALSLARRVSEELGENKQDIGSSRSLVGYSIRLEANVSKETRLVYATTGIVMRMLESSNELSEVTHLVLDEVHERSIDSDFLLIVLKRLMTKRKDLKVILMSATVNADLFSSYLGGAPILNVPGRTFPVDVRYLEDAIELTGYTPVNSSSDKMIDLDEDLDADTEQSGDSSSQNLSGYSLKTRSSLAQMDEYQIDFDLIVHLIAQVSSSDELEPYSKAILVFLPGIAEIRTLNDFLLGDPRFAKNWLVYPLHSSIATEDQESAFLVPPPGMRKVVLATNIAETGITIPDVTCVIDTGKHREMRFDERRQLSRLIDCFISRANAKQRRGRAGRVQNGLCFHMFTKNRHDTMLNDHQTPEMLRLSLQDLAIRVKICKIGGIEETLGDALDPPSAKNIRRAIDALVDVRALTQSEELTPLGHQLARLPLDVFLGKLILLGTVFKCLDMALTLAAILSSKSPFSAPFGQRAQADNARAAFRRADSDLLTVYNAYSAWKKVCQSNSGIGKEMQFCRKNFLSQQTLCNIEDLKGQLLVSVADSGFLSLTDEERKNLSRTRAASAGRGRRQQHFYEVPRRVNINSDIDVISSSVVAWSFYPKLLVRDTPGTKGVRNIGNNQSISIHPSSVNRGHLEIKWLSYYHIMQSKSVYRAHETTATDPFAVALFCGDVKCDMFAGVITLDGNRARFAIPDWKTMLAIKILRSRLREMLNKSFKQPGKMLTSQLEKWLEAWQLIFSQDFNVDKSIGVARS